MRPFLTPRPRALLAVAAVATLTLTACGGSAEPPEALSSQPVEGGAELAAVWPLTGEPVETETPDHPVMVVKIDNSAASQPQVGLGEADLITQEMVEGGFTRLAAMYYQQLPDEVGPVRSMRATDIGIVKPALGVIVASGGAPSTIERMARTEVPTRLEDEGEGWSRSSERRMPYNLFVDLEQLAAGLDELARVPTSYLPWGEADDFEGEGPATEVDVVYSPAHTTSWRYVDGTYVDDGSLAAEGDRFEPDSVLVLRVEQGDAGYLDPAGFAVPESIYQGAGPATLFHGGEVLRGTWSKSSRRQPLRLRTDDGEEMAVPAGRVWIELLPRDSDGGRLDVS